MTPLTSLQRPRACLPSGGTSHMLLLATTTQFDLAHLKSIKLDSLRLGGECPEAHERMHGQPMI